MPLPTPTSHGKTFTPRRVTTRRGTPRRVWRPFLLNLSLVIILFIMGIFIGFVFRTSRIIENQQVSTARAYFKNIVLTRRWNAGYGGVYIKKTKGVVSNPFLENPDITTEDGQVYTMKNPALMTREISVYAEEDGDFRYHITSLKPLNPDNRPDAFEARALQRFETDGVKEVFSTLPEMDGFVFRYMAPLKVEPACMACHEKQGYDVGDIRGGISVSFDVTGLKREMSRNKMTLIGLSVATISILLTVVFLMVSRLARQLTSAYQTIEDMLVIDDLTQVYNRRYFFPRLSDEIARARRYDTPLSLLFLDIDHFKQINDAYGHPFGDRVLKTMAGLLVRNVRQVDVVARYGGEEFAVLLPETESGQAVTVAEKLRHLISVEQLSFEGEPVTITASMGIASLDMTDMEDQDAAAALLKLADDALYAAKGRGRNRTVLASEL